MKVKFFLLSLFILLICSGCTVEYNLNIDDKLNLNESITINGNSEEDINKIRDFNSYLPVDISIDDSSAFNSKKDDIEYYNVKKKKNDSVMNFDYSYDVDLFNNNVFVRSCYEYVTVMDSYNEEEKRDELLLSTSNKFLCFDQFDNLDSVVIKIKTKRDVYFNNADNVIGNTYIWNITEGNLDDATINMVLSSEIIGSKLSFWERNALFLISLGVVLLIVIVYKYLKKRSEKINEI